MKSLRGRDSWPLLGISDMLLQELSAKHCAGATPHELIDWLQAQHVPKPGATLALRLAGVMQGSEVKVAVHFHPAYAYRREADEAFQEAAITAIEASNHSEAA